MVQKDDDVTVKLDLTDETLWEKSFVQTTEEVKWLVVKSKNVFFCASTAIKSASLQLETQQVPDTDAGNMAGSIHFEKLILVAFLNEVITY